MNGEGNYLDKLKKCHSISDFIHEFGLELSAKKFGYIVYGMSDSEKYKSFDIPKANGKGVRTIHQPNHALKTLQRQFADIFIQCVNEIRRQNIRYLKCNHAFERSKSIISNAKQHQRKKYLLNIDIANFFESIHFGRIKGFLTKDKYFSMSDSGAKIIATLATYDNKLPQGSPLSPILATLIGNTIDVRLIKLAKKYKFTYTRYADDITFSSNLPFPPELIDWDSNQETWVAGNILEQAIQKTGFRINPAKTRCASLRLRQSVTGLVVNKHVNVCNEYKKQNRAMVHSLITTGSFYRDKNEDSKGTVEQLIGRLNYAVYAKYAPQLINLIKQKKKQKNRKKLEEDQKTLEKEVMADTFQVEGTITVGWGKDDKTDARKSGSMSLSNAYMGAARFPSKSGKHQRKGIGLAVRKFIHSLFGLSGDGLYQVFKNHKNKDDVKYPYWWNAYAYFEVDGVYYKDTNFAMFYTIMLFEGMLANPEMLKEVAGMDLVALKEHIQQSQKHTAEQREALVNQITHLQLLQYYYNEKGGIEAVQKFVNRGKELGKVEESELEGLRQEAELKEQAAKTILDNQKKERTRENIIKITVPFVPETVKERKERAKVEVENQLNQRTKTNRDGEPVFLGHIIWNKKWEELTPSEKAKWVEKQSFIQQMALLGYDFSEAVIANKYEEIRAKHYDKVEERKQNEEGIKPSKEVSTDNKTDNTAEETSDKGAEVNVEPVQGADAQQEIKDFGEKKEELKKEIKNELINIISQNDDAKIEADNQVKLLRSVLFYKYFINLDKVTIFFEGKTDIRYFQAAYKTIGASGLDLRFQKYSGDLKKLGLAENVVDIHQFITNLIHNKDFLNLELFKVNSNYPAIFVLDYDEGLDNCAEIKKQFTSGKQYVHIINNIYVLLLSPYYQNGNKSYQEQPRCIENLIKYEGKPISVVNGDNVDFGGEKISKSIFSNKVSENPDIFDFSEFSELLKLISDIQQEYNYSARVQ